ncbi:MAG: MFS transporter [Desulfococcaceae bacterium]
MNFFSISSKEIHAPGKIFFGWYIAGVVFLAHFMSVGTGFYAMNAFMQPLCGLRGWTRTDLNLALAGATTSGFIAQFIYGSLLSRVQIRWLMLGGVLAAGFSFICMMRVTVLWQFHLLYIILYMGNGAYGGIVANTAINNWFHQKRGKALGIATAGISLAGAVIPFVAMHIIFAHGIQAAANIIGACILCLGPVIWWVIRDWPETYGLEPDGLPGSDKSIKNTADSGMPGRIWNAAALVRTPAFWKLGIAFGLLMSGTAGVMTQLKPRFADIGFDDTNAMIMLSVTALIATAGKYLWGRLCDRMTPWLAGSVMALVNALGLAVALLGNAIPAVICFAVIFGFAMGGIMSIYPVITASMFGRLSFARVYRFMSLFLIAQTSGYVIAGQSYDRFGSYDPAYICFIVFDIIAAVLLWSIRK